MDEELLPGVGTFSIKNESETQDSFDSVGIEINIDHNKKEEYEQRMRSTNGNFETSLDESAHDFDDADFSLSSFSQSKPRRKRKSTAGIRKIQHVWTDDEIKRLIASVEQHPGLWNIASPEYKLSKLDGWRSVVNELGIDGVNVNEAKVKWSSLRTTFMVNLSNLRKRKSGRRTNGSHTVSWKFFNPMKFLKTNNVKHSTMLPLTTDTIDTYIVDELPPNTLKVSASEFVQTSISSMSQNMPSENTSGQILSENLGCVEESMYQHALNNLPSIATVTTKTTPEFADSNRRKRLSSRTPTTPEFADSNQRKRLSSRTPTPPPSPSPSNGSTSAQAISILNSAVASLHSTDTNSTFCNNLLAELRTLSESKARTLRYKISRLMMDFIEAAQDPPHL